MLTTKPLKRLPYKTGHHKCFVTMPIRDGVLHKPEAFIREYTQEMLSHFNTASEEVIFARAVLEITTKLPEKN